MDPRDRTALVTGGAVRVGRAISLALAEQGARVLVHYNRSVDDAEKLVEEIRGGGGEAAHLGADLTSMAEVSRLASEASSVLGPIDILVNSASVFPAEPLADVSPELWDETLAVNLRAPFFLTQRLGGEMKQRGEGVVINMGDLAGIETWSGYAAHSVSKAGILHLTRVAARALAPEVRVSAIAPGTVLPPEDMSDEEIERLARRAPLRRNGSPDDVVAALLFLIRSDFITGEVIVLDGGRSLT